jgi:hypothetical protein
MAAPKYQVGQKVKFLFNLTELRTGKITACEPDVSGSFMYRFEGMQNWYEEEDCFEIKVRTTEEVAA